MMDGSCVIGDDDVIRMPDGRDAMLVTTEDFDEIHQALHAISTQLDYLQNLWGKEGITDGLAQRVRAAFAKSMIINE